MNEVARSVLLKLLRKAENRRLKGTGTAAITVLFNQRGVPEYETLDYQARRTCHADLREAARHGAIEIEWDRRAGEDGRVLRIILADDRTLADRLNVVPAWDNLAQAQNKLADHAQLPGVARILALWAAGKKARNIDPEDAGKVLQALKVIEICAGRDETPVRRLSARLFADSKYVENNLHALLDELTRGENDPPVSESEDVLRRIGLIKHPQPLLIAGQGTVKLAGNRKVSLVEPYLGIAPDAFEGMRFDGTLCRDVLTIENLTTFNEAARSMSGSTPALILYTGGVPAPSWRRAYAVLAGSLPAQVRFWHWGDIDEGGFRIASMIAALLPEGKILRPWLMSPAEVAEAGQSCTAASTRKAMIRYAKLTGWDEVARQIEREPITIEQEVLAPSLPF